VGDFVVFNDKSTDPDNPGRRSYECAQIIGPGAEGEVVPSATFVLQRASVHTTHSLGSDTDLLCITKCPRCGGSGFGCLEAQEHEDQATAHFRQPRAYPSAEFALQFERAWEKDVVFQVNVKV